MMKTRRWAGCVAVLALALTWVVVARVASASPVKGVVAGVVIVTQGKPQLKKAGQADFGPLKRNSFVYEGDLIKTGAKDLAAVAFMGGAEVRIAENSSFLVESGGGQKPTSLRTDWGKAWTRLLHGKAGLKVRTPVAVCSVRGTEADVESVERLTVKVYEGFVDVYNDKGRQSLAAGQMTQVANAQAAPQPPRQMGPQDKGTWQDALKVAGTEKQIERLKAEAQKRRDVELQLNDGGRKKKLKLQLEKK